jgi:hypothetical protein
MKRSILAGGLAVVAVTLFGVGCSDQGLKQDAQKAAKAVAEEAGELGAAAREGAAAQAGRDLEAAGRAATDAVDSEGIAGAARNAADSAAETARANVEESARTELETYHAARKSGEGVVEAAGDAENAVLAIPDEKDAKKQAVP